MDRADGTIAPAAMQLATPIPTFPPMTSSSFSTTSNETNQAQTALMSLIVFFVMMVTLLCFVLFMNCSNRRSTATLPGDAATTTNAHQQVDFFRSMTPEDRKAYVTNFLKTQKFEETGTFIRRKKLLTQPPPTLKDEDVDTNLSIRSTGVPYSFCAICLDPFQKGEDVCSAQNKLCPHQFHLTCIFPWLLKSQECPCCRRDYLSVEQDAIELFLKEYGTHDLSLSMHSI